MSKYKQRGHVVWKCYYHIVWCPKYRFRILPFPQYPQLRILRILRISIPNKCLLFPNRSPTYFPLCFRKSWQKPFYRVSLFSSPLHYAFYQFLHYFPDLISSSGTRSAQRACRQAKDKLFEPP